MCLLCVWVHPHSALYTVNSTILCCMPTLRSVYTLRCWHMRSTVACKIWNGKEGGGVGRTENARGGLHPLYNTTSLHVTVMACTAPKHTKPPNTTKKRPMWLA